MHVRPPADGFEYLAGGPSRVLGLRQAIYGLRQAPRTRNGFLKAERTKQGFVHSNADPGLWLLCSKDKAGMSMFYADGILAAARSDDETSRPAETLVYLIATMSAIRRLVEPQDVLGIVVLRDWGPGNMILCHDRKAFALAQAFDVAGQRR